MFLKRIQTHTETSQRRDEDGRNGDKNEEEKKPKKQKQQYMRKNFLNVSRVVKGALDGIIRTLMFTSVSTSTGPVLKGNLNGVCIMV